MTIPEYKLIYSSSPGGLSSPGGWYVFTDGATVNLDLSHKPTDKRQTVKSMAVIVNTKREGIVLWYNSGSDIEFEIDEITNRLDDLGLDDAPIGISIWEGVYKWIPGSYEHPEDGNMDACGSFRRPTIEEWAKIHANENPWH